MTLGSLYQRLPTRLQTVACTAEGWRIQRARYGGAFPTLFRDAMARTFVSPQDIDLYRDERVRRFVEHCERTVPFYRRQFRALGLDPGEIKTLADLQQLPVLTREVVQEHRADFISEVVSRKDRIEVHTSGSTGAALHFHTTLPAVREQWATWWRYWGWHGIERGTWCAAFGGHSIVPPSRSRPPFWRYNYAGRQILFSLYHTSPTNLDSYLAELRRSQPPWIHGFPSVLALLAERALEIGFDLGYRLRWITIGGENLLAHQAVLMERAFGVRPKQHYGLKEATANVSECPSGSFHVDEDFAAVEFIPATLHGAARIVGTNFTNFATPLIRYDSQDVATVTSARCTCGRPGRVIASIDGRIYDYVVLKNGERLIGLDYIFEDMTNVREAQIFQRVRGEIVFRIVRRAGYGEADEVFLLREARERLTDDTEVRVEYIDQVERTPTGKLRFVVNELPEGRNVSTAAVVSPSTETTP